ncbi:hypothetical protein V6N13_125369 [Hibiscus sabdariffa]
MTTPLSSINIIAKLSRLVKGARIGRERLAINHLFFADDSILFGEATVDDARHGKTIINQYTFASGQQVNFDKSLLFFSSNAPSHLKDAIGFNLGARISSNLEKYLGLPTMVGRRKKEAFCYFLDSVTDRILCIPLAVTKPPDELVWGIGGSGLYSPKSGYRLLLEEDLQASRDRSISSSNSVSEFFNNLSKLKIPSKCKIFLWRLFHDYLPTKSNLQQRRIQVGTSLDYKSWLIRNQVLHEGKRQSIARISTFIRAHIAELHSVAALSLPSMPTPSSSWSPPTQGIIKFNFDTTLTIATMEAYSGVIARNSHGLIMVACVLHHSAVNNAFIAKARACEAGVNFAIELGLQSIHVEGDSLSVIKKLSSSSVDKSIISPIISDIKYKLIFFEKITFSHVGRQVNEVAHLLAQAHSRFHLPQYWIEDALPEVEQAALRDLRQ